MAWLIVASTTHRKTPRTDSSRARSQSSGAGITPCVSRYFGRLAMAVTTKKVGKFRESTAEVRPSAPPTRKSASANRPAGSEAYGMTAFLIGVKPYQGLVAMGRFGVH